MSVERAIRRRRLAGAVVLLACAAATLRAEHSSFDPLTFYAAFRPETLMRPGELPFTVSLGGGAASSAASADGSNAEFIRSAFSVFVHEWLADGIQVSFSGGIGGGIAGTFLIPVPPVPPLTRSTDWRVGVAFPAQDYVSGYSIDMTPRFGGTLANLRAGKPIIEPVSAVAGVTVMALSKMRVNRAVALATAIAAAQGLVFASSIYDTGDALASDAAGGLDYAQCV